MPNTEDMDEFDKAAWEEFANQPFTPWTPENNWRAKAARKREAAQKVMSVKQARFRAELNDIIDAFRGELTEAEIADVIKDVRKRLAESN
jgi:hypothetical protein